MMSRGLILSSYEIDLHVSETQSLHGLIVAFELDQVIPCLVVKI
jgi:hypothetical protein